MKTTLAACLAILIFLAAARPTHAMFSYESPQEVPVDRLITNLQAFIKENPENAPGYYSLGRVHYLAYVLKSDELRSFNVNGSTSEETGYLLKDKKITNHPPTAAPDGFQRLPSKNGRIFVPRGGPQLPPEQLLHHAKEGVSNLRRAIELDPKAALYPLCLASLLEQSSTLSDQVSPWAAPPQPIENLSREEIHQIRGLLKNLISGSASQAKEAQEKLIALINQQTWEPINQLSAIELKRSDLTGNALTQAQANLKNLWTAVRAEQTIQAFLSAHQLAWLQDQKINSLPSTGPDSILSYEAGNAYLTLIRARGIKPAEQATVDTVDSHINKLTSIKARWVTPIIFHLDTPLPLEALTDNNRKVCFDLDGLNRQSSQARPWTWSWVQPTTAILVWDPNHTGIITSGHQLFGNVTFNIFWENGYRAMDALDDNRDGFLAGSELTGLSLWHDRNSNGISDPGEVTTLQSAGIQSLRTREINSPSQVPMNPMGLQTKDHRWLPTYDWISTGTQ
jgi:hypothetical protein